MKLLETWKWDGAVNIIGIQWYNCSEHPPMTIEKPDLNYWNYIVFVFCFGSYQRAVQLRLTKTPYKNKVEYLKYRKTLRKPAF